MAAPYVSPTSGTTYDKQQIGIYIRQTEELRNLMLNDRDRSELTIALTQLMKFLSDYHDTLDY